LENVGRCQFAKNAHGWGWSKFISLESFKDSSKGYLVKKSVALKLRLQLLVPPRRIRLPLFVWAEMLYMHVFCCVYLLVHKSKWANKGSDMNMGSFACLVCLQQHVCKLHTL
jgi:hypothetical protein